MKKIIISSNENDEQITEFVEAYKKDFLGYKMVEFNANNLLDFSPKLYDGLLENPSEIIKNIQSVIGSKYNEIKIHFFNIFNQKEIHGIRGSDIGKFVSLKGIIKRVTKVLPRVLVIKYECPGCGTLLSIPQEKKKRRAPSNCPCGRKAGFMILSEEIVDIQEINLEEIQDNLDGKQPQQIRVYLENELTEINYSNKLRAGRKIEIIGEVKKLPAFMTIKDEESNLSEFMIHANNVIPLDAEEDGTITDEDEKTIKEIASDNPLSLLAKNIAPEIFGNEVVKKALVLQMVRGVPKLRTDGTMSKEDIHILLSGDVGIAKSQALKAAVIRTPRAKMVVGTKTSRVGISAMAVKDELTNSWSVTGDTLIPILDNENNFHLKRIEELYNENNFAQIRILGVDEKTRVQSWIKCKNIICHPFNGKIINLKQKYGEITATECHSIYDREMKTFQSQENKEMYALRNINIPTKDSFEISLIEIINKKDKKTGRFLGNGKFMKSAYSKECDIKDLLKVCAWYISGGCLTANESKKLWQTTISNNNREELSEVARAWQRISQSKSNLTKYGGKRYNKLSRGNMINVIRTSSLQLTSKQLYYFLKENCGHYSINKKIPNFIFNLNSIYKEYFFNELMKGDGCFKFNSYTTISKDLATGIGLLLSTLNKNFSYSFGKIDKNHPNSAYQIILIDNNFNNKDQSQKLTQFLLDNFADKWFSVRDFERLCSKGLNRKYNKKNYIKSFMFIKRLNKRELLEKKIINSRKILWRIKAEDFKKRIKHIKENKGVSNKMSMRHSVEELVYDIVNSETSNFVGGLGNILLHNSLECGTLVICNGSTVAVDEIDKMYKENLSELLEPMSNGTVSINKAGISAVLPARTSVLAAANPIHGNYDLSQPLAKQIDLPSPILNRFDLIFILLDKPNKQFDHDVVGHIFKSMNEKPELEVSIELFKKYITYCRKLRPKLKPELEKSLQDFYVLIRQGSQVNESNIKGIPINIRNLEGLIRLSEAHAKLRLSEWVELSDLEVAKEIFMFCLKQIGIDSETGLIDQSRITSKVPISKLEKVKMLLPIINSLQKEFGFARLQQIKDKSFEQNIESYLISDMLEMLKKEAQIIEERKGEFKLL